MSLNYVALMKMREAEEDNAEACLDAAGSSHDGDKFNLTPGMMHLPRDEWMKNGIMTPDEARTMSGLGNEFEPTPPIEFDARAEWKADDRQLADARCARCSEGDDFALLISGMDDAMIAYADRVLGDDPVWSRLKALRQAMSESL